MFTLVSNQDTLDLKLSDPSTFYYAEINSKVMGFKVRKFQQSSKAQFLSKSRVNQNARLSQPIRKLTLSVVGNGPRMADIALLPILSVLFFLVSWLFCYQSVHCTSFLLLPHFWKLKILISEVQNMKVRTSSFDIYIE